MKPRKLTKEDLDKVRDIEGFPIGTDENIIALSDPPYYTACPNPFIADFIKEHGTPYDEATDDYHCEPFAADVSEGKNDPIYNAHTYHTKVPYKAIMRYILHYTKPGDIVYDGFCGTGMTGVAARMCGNPDDAFKNKIQLELKHIKWGNRNAVLNDLAPIATLISSNFVNNHDIEEFVEEANQILAKAKEECGWMYQTTLNNSVIEDTLFEERLGVINYTVWSDVLSCPNCGKEIVFYDAAVDSNTGKVSDIFNCPHCGVKLSKTQCDRVMKSYFDEYLMEDRVIIKQVPVLINYRYGKKRYNKKPDEFDKEIINKVDSYRIPYYIPLERMREGRESRRNDKIGLMYAHDYFYKRTLIFISKVFDLICESKMKNLLKIWFTSQIINISKMNRYRPQVSFPYNPLSGTLYVSSMISEVNPYFAYEGKIKKFYEALSDSGIGKCIVSCHSTTGALLPAQSVDYIFTDPPFGDNLNYCELSFLWESWLGIKTSEKLEAIVNVALGKGLYEYQELMTRCFKEYFRVLKPNRWMTVEFHNSKNAVWNAIQQSIQLAGFIVADVRTLDKQQGSFKQVNNNSAVKQDLVISAYKPKESFKRTVLEQAGKPETAWAFVQQHLANLPVVVDADNNGKIDILPERQAYLLFDRMVAYHIMQGIPVPLDATDFYNGLDERFMKRDGMYFLPDQVNEYDEARIKMDVENIEMSLFVTNEKSAIAWLYQQLGNEMGQPQTYAELQPKFMQEVRAVDKYEDIPELQVLLEENFLQDSEGKWYVPDRTKEGDVAKLREKKLLKEFEGYCASKGKLKLFRSEAIRLGFTKMWKEKNYQGIVNMAKRLPEQVIQEDQNLLMYYDLSLDRV